MFRNIFGFHKGKHFIEHVFQEFAEMLDDTEMMFKAVVGRLLDHLDEPNLKARIYKLDGRVNSLERNIRKRVAEHLAVQPTVDVPASLVLMSVVKDAERLGDYVKNLYEVTELLAKPIDKALYEEYFGRMDADILTLFARARQAFVEEDEAKARAAWDCQKSIKERCEKALCQIVNSTLSVNEAVCLSLVARYFKRPVSHLVNIATASILPLDELDYFDERILSHERADTAVPTPEKLDKH